MSTQMRIRDERGRRSTGTATGMHEGPHVESVFDADYEYFTRSSFPAERNSSECDLITSIVSMRPGAKVLDMPCGYGRIGLELAKRGFDVVGIDIKDEFLRSARADARAAGVTVQYVCADMRELNAFEEFDVALTWCNSFGYYDDETSLDILARTRRALRPGGCFILDVVNPVQFHAAIVSRAGCLMQRHRVDEATVFDEFRLDRAGTRAILDRVICRDGGVTEASMSLRLVTCAEISDWAARCGFDSVDFFNENGQAFGWRDEHLIAVAAK